MLRYAIRRLLLLPVVLLGVTLITFLLLRAIPGNPIDRMASDFVPTARIEQMKREAGLSDPLPVQYVRYVFRLVRGDAGTSFVTGLPVASELAEAIPATVELTLISMIVTITLGITLGVAAAVRRGGILDHIVRVIAVGGVSIPLFWLGLVLIYVAFFKFNIVPAPLGRIEPLIQPPERVTGLYVIDAVLSGNFEALRSSARALILPVITLAASSIAPIARLTRSEMIEALESDYVRTTISLGLPRARVLRHALWNGLLPIVTMAASTFGYLLSGSVLVEAVFSWPGLGSYAFNAIANNDYNAVQAYIVMIASMYVVIYLLLDVAYHAVDPRVRA